MQLLTSPGALANAAIALVAIVTLLVRLSRAWRQPSPAAAETRDYFINFILAAIFVAAILGLRVFLETHPPLFARILLYSAA